MKFLSYIFKNLKVTVRKSPGIFGLYVLCNVVAVLVILFSHGVYQNYTVKNIKEEKEVYQKGARFTFGNKTERITNDGNNDGKVDITYYKGDGTTTVGEFKKVLDLLDHETKSGFTGFVIEYVYEEETEYTVDGAFFQSRIEYYPETQKYGLFQTFVSNQGISKGRYISSEEEFSGEKVIVLPNGENADPPINNSELVGKTIEFLGEEYEVIGILSTSTTDRYHIPFGAIPDHAVIKTVRCLDDQTITTQTFREIKKAFTEVYGDYVNFPEMETIDEDNQTFYASIIMMSVVLSALAGITLAILFRYIVYTRRKTLAVLRLNGCTRFKARIMYLIECLGISSILYLVSALCYNKFILPELTRFFPSISEVYSCFTYLYIYLVFIGVLFVIVNVMISFQIDKQPVNMFRKGG